MKLRKLLALAPLALSLSACNNAYKDEIGEKYVKEFGEERFFIGDSENYYVEVQKKGATQGYGNYYYMTLVYRTGKNVGDKTISHKFSAYVGDGESRTSLTAFEAVEDNKSTELSFSVGIMGDDEAYAPAYGFTLNMKNHKGESRQEIESPGDIDFEAAAKIFVDPLEYKFIDTFTDYFVEHNLPLIW